MAHYFSINVGQNEYQATDGATTANTDIEIVINYTANVPSKEDLLLAIEKLENYIIRTPKDW